MRSWLNFIEKLILILNKMKNLNEKVKISWRISSYIGMIFLSAFIAAPIALATGSILFSLIPFIVILPLTEWMVRLSYKNYKYELVKDALKIEKGVITKVYKSIPYGRIQNVDIQRGILSRMLGLSTVLVHTAGYSGPQQYAQAEGYIPGVLVDEAEKIREAIIKAAKK